MADQWVSVCVCVCEGERGKEGEMSLSRCRPSVYVCVCVYVCARSPHRAQCRRGSPSTRRVTRPAKVFWWLLCSVFEKRGGERKVERQSV